MTTADTRLVMTLLVRDEIDIIRENVVFHLAQGVDYIIATDNGSTDGTREYLAELEADGIATIIDEPEQNYAQSEWVTRMAIIAREHHGADWILHNDADEFWSPQSGSLKSELDSQTVNMFSCERHNLLPEETVVSRADFSFVDITARFSKPFDPDAACLGLRYPSLTTRVGPKVITRAQGLINVAQGNHCARMADEHRANSANILIYHFPLRTFDQFERKVVNGGASYARNTRLPFEVGWHWRRWYELCQADRLRDEYDRLVLTSDQIKRLVAAGRVVIDPTVREALRTLNARILPVSI